MGVNLERLEAELEALRTQDDLLEETNVEARAQALDFLTFVREVGRMRAAPALGARAAALAEGLEEIDRRLCARIEAAIRDRTYSQQALRQELDRYTGYRPQDQGAAHIGYDGLDVIINGVLLAEPLPVETRERTPEMIQYEATPARYALELVDRVHLGDRDVFYDLGSGLGHIVLLVHLLSGVEARGIEFEPAFCAYARRAADRLGVSGAHFIEADAREIDYREGTIFFLFTPFRGQILQQMLARLRQVAAAHPITVCSYGSSTLSIAAQEWLVSLDGNMDDEFKLACFGSRIFA